MEEYFFQCPCCWETISMLIDKSQTNQKYIEDCEICCNPIEVRVATDLEEITNFQADSIDQ